MKAVLEKKPVSVFLTLTSGLTVTYPNAMLLNSISCQNDVNFIKFSEVKVCSKSASFTCREFSGPQKNKTEKSQVGATLKAQKVQSF